MAKSRTFKNLVIEAVEKHPNKSPREIYNTIDEMDNYPYFSTLYNQVYYKTDGPIAELMEHNLALAHWLRDNYRFTDLNLSEIAEKFGTVQTVVTRIKKHLGLTKFYTATKQGAKVPRDSEFLPDEPILNLNVGDVIEIIDCHATLRSRGAIPLGIWKVHSVWKHHIVFIDTQWGVRESFMIKIFNEEFEWKLLREEENSFTDERRA